MAKYDGLIIPRSYSEYINKTDAATLSQALQLGGVLDSAPTEDSVKAVKSGGVFDAIASAQSDLQDKINTKQDILTFDNVPTEDSDNPVKSGGIYDALGTKQDTLTFDDTPTASSNNPVKSGGIAAAFNDFFIIQVSETKSFTANANTTVQVTMRVTIPNGYKAITIVETDVTGVQGAVILYAVSIGAIKNQTGTFEYSIWLRNVTSSSQSGTTKNGILCQKTF